MTVRAMAHLDHALRNPLQKILGRHMTVRSPSAGRAGVWGLQCSVGRARCAVALRHDTGMVVPERIDAGKKSEYRGHRWRMGTNHGKGCLDMMAIMMHRRRVSGSGNERNVIVALAVASALGCLGGLILLIA